MKPRLNHLRDVLLLQLLGDSVDIVVWVENLGKSPYGSGWIPTEVLSLGGIEGKEGQWRFLGLGGK
jgi:hypothetical protein